MMVRCQGGEGVYSPIIRSLSFSEPVPWTVNFTSVSQSFSPCLGVTGRLGLALDISLPQVRGALIIHHRLGYS